VERCEKFFLDSLPSVLDDLDSQGEKMKKIVKNPILNSLIIGMGAGVVAALLGTRFLPYYVVALLIVTFIRRVSFD
jgi:hypothetical protein